MQNSPAATRFLRVPAYVVALLLVLFPLLDTTLAVLPIRAGEVTWRFGALGLFSRALMTPALGVLVGFTVAVLAQQRRVLYAIAIASGVACVVLMLAGPLFLLDALQMRRQVTGEMQRPFDVAAAVALIKIMIGCIITVLFTLYAWKAARASVSRRDQSRQGLIRTPGAASASV